MSNFVTKLFMFVFIICPVAVFPKDESPYDNFSAKKNFTKKTTITWEYVIKDINKRCNEESKRLGQKGFSFNLDACSFWKENLFGNTCHIITLEKVNMWTVGHEVRHCFQGDFH